jgi:actin-like ATPase involved in cell morphogenesis/sugar lactone lactonase YvrE
MRERVTYDLGIDLGTTYTAAAVFRSGRVDILQLGDRAAAVPSVVFVRDAEEPLIGEAANRRSLTDPGRVAREFKRRLGDTTPIILGTSPYSPETLVAALLRWVVASAVKQEGEQAAHITVCHPANWGPYKREVLSNAVRMAELDGVDYLTEPEAAAIFYASSERLEQGDVLAVYDLGGGTFDATVLAKTGTGFEILGQPEGIEHLGGIDFDRAVFAHVNRALGSTIDELDPEDPTAMAAVVRLRQECTEAKEALSSDTEVSIAVLLPNVQTEVRLSRGEFEAMIRPAIAETVEALKRAIRSAGVKAEDLAKILLVGGSSRIPLVGEIVSAELGRPVAVDAHPKHSIAIGAAIAAARSDGVAIAPETAEISPPPPEATAEHAKLDMGAGPAVAAETPVAVPAPTPTPEPIAPSTPEPIPTPASVEPAAVAAVATAPVSAEPAATVTTPPATVEAPTDVGSAATMKPPEAPPRSKPGAPARHPMATVITLVVLAGVAVGVLFLTGVIGGGGSGSSGTAAVTPTLYQVGTTATSATKVSATLPANPIGLAAGLGGVWLIEKNKGVVDIDPNSGARQRIPLPNHPTVIVDNGDLGVWIGARTTNGQGQLLHIDPSTHKIVKTISLPNVPTALWVSSTSTPPVVWVLSADSGNLFKVDPNAGKVLDSVFVGNGASDLAVTPNAVWVANPEAHTVTPIATATDQTLQAISLPGANSIAPAGSTVWVVDTQGGRAFPIDTSNGHVEGAVSVGSAPTRIRMGNGVLWVADSTNVLRIDPKTQAVTKIAIGKPVYSIFASHLPGPGDKPLWVLVATRPAQPSASPTA